MKSKSVEKKDKAGRNTITVDWDEVDRYLVGGSNGVQIAAMLGICNDTLFRRCEEDHKMTFSDYAAKKRAKGDSYLHNAQFKAAMKGNTSMLIWLGKQRLGQKEDQNKNQTMSIEQFKAALLDGSIVKLLSQQESNNDSKP